MKAKNGTGDDSSTEFISLSSLVFVSTMVIVKAASGLERIMCTILSKQTVGSSEMHIGRYDIPITETTLKTAMSINQSTDQPSMHLSI